MDNLWGASFCQPKCLKSLQENRTKRMCVFVYMCVFVCMCVCVCVYKGIYFEESDHVIEEA